MNIEGTYTLQATAAEVWRSLLDQQVLRRTIPGIESLELLDGHKYDITLRIKHTPLNDSYHGQITVTEQHYPSSYRLVFAGEGRQATFNGGAEIQLGADSEHTIVSYNITLTISKSSVLLPPSLVKGMVKLLIQQFFTALADYLRTLQPSASTPVTPDVPQNVSPSKQAAPTQSPLLYTIVHFLRLGHGDPLLEEHWVNRVRRVSIISGLLLLVWVGTRLPGKPKP